MAVTTTWNRRDTYRKNRVAMLKMSYGNGDTSVVAATGLKIINSVEVSPTSVNTKIVTRMVVSGGTVTLTVTDPLEACYLFITAQGI